MVGTAHHIPIRLVLRDIVGARHRQFSGIYNNLTDAVPLPRGLNT
jgi:hypothetical protein